MTLTSAPTANHPPMHEHHAALRLVDLTDREREVLSLIGLGLSMAEISRRMSRTIKTIEWYRASLGKKLGVKNRVQLARLAIASGLIAGPDASGQSPDLAGGFVERALGLSRAFAWEWCEQQRELRVSRTLIELCGHTPASFGEPRFALPRLMCPRTFSQSCEVLWNAGGEHLQTEEIPLCLVHKSGSLLETRCRLGRERDEHGRVRRTGGVSIIERELPATPQGRLHDIDRVGAWEWHAQDDRVLASGNLHRHLGKRPEQIPAGLLGWHAMNEPAGEPEARAQWDRAIRARRPLERTVKRLTGDGRVRTYSERVVFLSHPGGAIARVLAQATLLD